VLVAEVGDFTRFSNPRALPPDAAGALVRPNPEDG
jgi:hypothetical protein